MVKLKGQKKQGIRNGSQKVTSSPKLSLDKLLEKKQEPIVYLPRTMFATSSSHRKGLIKKVMKHSMSNASTTQEPASPNTCPPSTTTLSSKSVVSVLKTKTSKLFESQGLIKSPRSPSHIVHDGVVSLISHFDVASPGKKSQVPPPPSRSPLQKLGQ
jgi:hypothetical protein